MTEAFSLPIRVYIEDTDAGGIVYYVNYLKFMERARTECLRAMGFDHYTRGDEPVLFVVRRVEVDYKIPARLDDALQATARITRLGRASLFFQQQILRDGALLAAGHVEVACVDSQSLKPRALPTRLQALLAQQGTHHDCNT